MEEVGEAISGVTEVDGRIQVAALQDDMARAWSRPATQLKEKWSRVTTETKSPRSSLSPGAHSGQLVGKLRELITDIKASQPVVVGIDEIDRIGSVEQGAVYQ